MGRKYKNLFDEIVGVENFYNAYQKTCKGKRSTNEFLVFDEWRYSNIHKLRKEIIEQNYQPKPPIKFTVSEPKPRNIEALQFEDRIVQHAMYSVLYPIFNRTFLPNSYACRKGFGTHKCARDVQLAAKKKRNWWYLKTDFSKYFHSIKRSLIWSAINAKIFCTKTKDLIEKFIPKDGVGIKIGELLSQLMANVAGNFVDMWLKHTKKVKVFFRYMDDIVIFGETKQELFNLKDDLRRFCKEIGFRFSKWFVKPIKSGINFVGYIIFADYKLIRKDSIRRAKRKLRLLENSRREMFLASWLGHISHADCYNLKLKLGVA